MIHTTEESGASMIDMRRELGELVGRNGCYEHPLNGLRQHRFDLTEPEGALA